MQFANRSIKTMLFCAALLACIHVLLAEEAREGSLANITLPSPALCASMTTDGKTVVVGCKDSHVRIWDTYRKTIRVLSQKEDAEPFAVAISPDNKLAACGVMASSSWASTIRIWNLETGKLFRTIECDSRLVYSLAFTPDNSRLVMSGFSLKHRAQEFDLETGKESRSFPGTDSDGCAPLAISRDGKLVAIGCYDQKIRVFNRETAEELLQFEYPSCQLSFSDDGKKLTAIDARDWDLIQLDMKNGKEIVKWTSMVNAELHCAFSPDGKFVLLCGEGDLIDLSSGKVVFEEEARKLNGNRLDIHNPIQATAMSSDSKRFVTGRKDGTLTLWSVDSVLNHNKK
jgi:WD40 repeat protein